MRMIPGQWWEWPYLFVSLCALAGAIHILSPDHWLPASVMAWQRDWNARRTFRFALAALAGHVALGALIYFAALPLLAHLRPSTRVGIGLAWVAVGLLTRMLRFPRVGEVLRSGPQSHWGMRMVLTLLGPCEAIFPILAKASSLGTGYLVPLGVFMTGTLLTGVTLIVSARLIWNRPFWLPRAVGWAYRRVSVFPVGAGVALGLTVLAVLF